jgi:peptidoglycan/xylan/chitin deacetylase (PgdA/CDA1 family)
MALAARALSKVRRRRAVVLGYNGVGESRRRDDLSFLVVSPDRFRLHIELLLEAGFRFVTLAELAREAAGRTPPSGLAALTFDAGMRNNHEVALPILTEYSIPATVYVTISFIARARSRSRSAAISRPCAGAAGSFWRS